MVIDGRDEKEEEEEEMDYKGIQRNTKEYIGIQTPTDLQGPTWLCLISLNYRINGVQ